MDSKRRRICSNKGDLHCQLDAKSYISLILTSLGYEDVSNEIKDELESFVQEWMKQFSNTITIKNIDTKVYDVYYIIDCDSRYYIKSTLLIGKCFYAIVHRKKHPPK